MQLGRRSFFMGASVSAASSLAATSLPVQDQFIVDQYEVCLNNARWHPMSRGTKQAVINYLDYKSRGVWEPPAGLNSPESIAVRSAFASLIGAQPAEIAFVNSTTAGENMIVAALGLHHPGNGNNVTDALYFEGSLYLNQELARRGIDVRIVKPRGWQFTPTPCKRPAACPWMCAKAPSTSWPPPATNG